MKVSIVMPVYNGEKYIEYAIKSVINQSYKKIQFILIDGGSSDRTMEIVNSYSEYFDLIISEKDDGMYSAINKGFSKSNGDLMLWLNSDDYIYPEAVKTVVTLFLEKPHIKWITGRNVYIDSNNRVRKIGCFRSMYKSLIKNGYHRSKALGCIMQETTIWHRDLYNSVGAYINVNYKLASDYELWTRFAEQETLYSINTFLGAFRQHGSQLSYDVNAYEKECDSIKKMSYIKKVILKTSKYPLYVFSMIDKKNKINIDVSGSYTEVKSFGVFM